MTVQEAIDYVRSQRVPDHLYALGDLGGGEIYGIDYLEDRWMLYYSERGERRAVEWFEQEDAAARRFLQRVAETLRAYEGRTLPLPANA